MLKWCLAEWQMKNEKKSVTSETPVLNPFNREIWGSAIILNMCIRASYARQNKLQRHSSFMIRSTVLKRIRKREEAVVEADRA
jgi:hypothetical protein